MNKTEDKKENTEEKVSKSMDKIDQLKDTKEVSESKQGSEDIWEKGDLKNIENPENNNKGESNLCDDEEDDDLVDEEDEESSEDEIDENYNIPELFPDELAAYKEMMDRMLYKIRSNERMAKQMNNLSVDDLVSMIENKVEKSQENPQKKKRRNKKKKKGEKDSKFEEKIEETPAKKKKQKKNIKYKSTERQNLKEISIDNPQNNSTNQAKSPLGTCLSFVRAIIIGK